MTFPETDLSASLCAIGIGFIKSLLLPFPSQRLTAEKDLEESWLKANHETLLDSAEQLLSTAGFGTHLGGGERIRGGGAAASPERG